jgi:hypothetical protein
VLVSQNPRFYNDREKAIPNVATCVTYRMTRVGGRHKALAGRLSEIIIRDFPDGPPPTNVVGDFAEHTEAWSVEQRFSWFAAVSIIPRPPSADEAAGFVPESDGTLGSSAYYLPHRWIYVQSLGIIDIFVTSQAALDRQTK